MAGRWFNRTWRICLLVILGSLPLSSVLASGTFLGNAPDEAWTHPTDLALNNLGPDYAGPLNMQSDRNFDCSPLTYQMLDDPSNASQTGCFTPTAFGMLDGDHNVVIFNGGSEGEPISNGGNLGLSALPFSADVVSFSGFPVNGTYFHLYKYFPNALRNQRTLFLQRYKQLIAAPDMTLTDGAGQPIAVNPSALAYSSRSQWLITESPSHSLVRINLATFSILPFAPSFTSSANPYLTHQAQLTISDDGRYAAVASSEFSSFKVYDLANCSGGSATDDLAPQNCQSHDYWPYVNSQVVGNLTGISHVRFVNDGLLSFDAGDASGANTYELSASGPITSLISYLGLGDSYASGQGAGNYLAATDTASNACHISGHSYPLLLNADEFSGAGHSVACAGATISDIDNNSPGYTGQTTDQRPASARETDGSDVSIVHDFTPGYLAQQTFVRDYQPGVITAEVGGNDVGFRDMLISCASPLASLHPPKTNPDNCFTSYEDRLEVEQTIDRTYRKWVSLYQQLQSTSPASRVYAVGYPQIVAQGGQCGLNVRLTSSEIGFTQDLIDYLNATILKAATAAGVHYVDISHALDGHRLCEASGNSIAMNGLTAGSDAYGVLGKDSYHPNALGQELMEQAILRTTHNFATPATKPVADPTVPAPTPIASDPLLNAPKTGRPINIVIPDDSITGDSVVRGSDLSITANGLNDGLNPGSSYTISLGDGTILGSLSTDSNGNLGGTLTVPSGAASGDQTINISGQNTAGDPIVITKVIYVDNSSNDYDGDGIPSTQDSCPTVINSGTDADHDNIDDVCDPIIASTSTGSSSSGTSGSSTSDTPNTSSSTIPLNTTDNQDSEDDVADLSIDPGTGDIDDTTLSGDIQNAVSPQQTNAVLGARTHLQPVFARTKTNPASGLFHHFPSLKIINWLPWTLITILSLLLLVIIAWLLNRQEQKSWA